MDAPDHHLVQHHQLPQYRLKNQFLAVLQALLVVQEDHPRRTARVEQPMAIQYAGTGHKVLVVLCMGVS